MKRLFVVLLILLLPTGAMGANNYAIRDNYFPTGASNAALVSLGGLASTTTVASKTDISFTDDGTADYIESVAGDFGSFQKGDTIQIASTSTTNNGYYTIDLTADLTAYKIILESNASLTTENAATAGTVTVTEWPTFYFVNSQTYNTTSMAATTRSGYPGYQGDVYDFYAWNKDNKIRIWEVGGDITCNDRIDQGSADAYDNNSISDYGQTAPLPVVLKGLTVPILGTDVVTQHLELWITNTTVPENNQDGMSPQGTRNLIDHCSFYGAKDESAGSTGGVNNAWSYCIFADSVTQSTLDIWDSKGILIDEEASGILLWKSVIANTYHRNPIVQQEAEAAVVNTLIYNPGVYGITLNSNPANNNYGGNYSLAGNILFPGTDSELYLDDYYFTFYRDPHVDYTDVWMEGNAIYSFSGSSFTTQANEDDWSMVREHGAVTYDGGGGNDGSLETAFKSADPPVAYGFTADAADADLLTDLIANAGAWPANRTPYTSGLAGEIEYDTGRIIRTDSITWPAVSDGARNVETGMAAVGLPVFPSSPWSDTLIMQGTNVVATAGNTRYNVLEWIDFLTTHGVENPYTPPDPDPGLVARWNFENDFTDETTTYDLGNSGVAFVTGGSQLKGTYSGDWENTDGDGDYAYVVNVTPFASLGGFTFTGWIKIENTAAVKNLFGLWDDVNNERVARLYVNGDLLGIDIGYNGGASSPGNIEHATNLSTNVRFVAGTYDETTDTAVLYVKDTNCDTVGDNYTDASVIGAQTWNKTETTDWLVGAKGSAGAGSQEFDGLMDDIRIYDTALTAQQVLNICSDTPGDPGPTFDSLTVANVSYTVTESGDQFNATAGTSETTVITRGSFEFETGTPDLPCSYSSGSHSASIVFSCGPLASGMRTAALALKSSELALDGGTITDTLGNAATLTLPALTGTVDISIPYTVASPCTLGTGGYFTTWAAFEAALVANDSFQLVANLGSEVINIDETGVYVDARDYTVRFNITASGVHILQ